MKITETTAANLLVDLQDNVNKKTVWNRSRNAAEINFVLENRPTLL